jgi:hypothetical protein
MFAMAVAWKINFARSFSNVSPPPPIVNADAVVTTGVTPTEILIFGVTVAINRIFPAPLEAVPTVACVMAPWPVVGMSNYPAVKSM